METKEILTEVDNKLTELIQYLSNFNQEQVNIVPFEGSWTAGQLARHMILANSGCVEMLSGPVKDTERKPDMMASKFKEDFLNFEIKMDSPDFVMPAPGDYNREELLSALESIRAKAIENIKTMDLTQTCTAFELPVYGYVTRLEVLCFVIYHTQRHIRQIKNIQQVVLNKTNEPNNILN